MTVKELIVLLQALPQDLPVYLGDWSEAYASDVPIDHVGLDGWSPLPHVEEARVDPPTWDHPRRVVIG